MWQPTVQSWKVLWLLLLKQVSILRYNNLQNVGRRGGGAPPTSPLLDWTLLTWYRTFLVSSCAGQKAGRGPRNKAILFGCTLLLYVSLCRCADSMREMLKSGQYMKYHGSISDERHCNIIFPKEGLEAVLKEIENSGIVPKIEDWSNTAIRVLSFFAEHIKYILVRRLRDPSYYNCVSNIWNKPILKYIQHMKIYIPTTL